SRSARLRGRQRRILFCRLHRQPETVGGRIINFALPCVWSLLCSIAVRITESAYRSRARSKIFLPPRSSLGACMQSFYLERMESPPRFCRSEEHTSELQSRVDLVCRRLL